MATATQHRNNDSNHGAAGSSEIAPGPRTFRGVLAELEAGTQSKVEKGRSFERLVKAFLERDNAQTQRFSRVWLWSDWPGNQGQHDVGIDVVAEERDGGDLVAIQCKFYGPSTQIVRDHVNSFLGAYGARICERNLRLYVGPVDQERRKCHRQLRQTGGPVEPRYFENSSIDWSTFDLNLPSDLSVRQTKDLYDYQGEALQDTITCFQDHDRGKLIMACGSGKTFTALRIAERVAGTGGTVLFLTPSISLLSQSLSDWRMMLTCRSSPLWCAPISALPNAAGTTRICRPMIWQKRPLPTPRYFRRDFNNPTGQQHDGSVLHLPIAGRGGNGAKATQWSTRI